MIALLLALATMPANTNIQIYNHPSLDSCGSWTRYRATKDAAPLEAWIMGFVSGANAYGATHGNIAPGVQAAGLLAWVDQYCTANPLDSVTQAGFRLVMELHRRSQK